jgi:hypothetical protein
LRSIGEAHYGDERFDGINYVLVDFRRANLAEITSDKPTVLASIDSTAVVYNSNIKIAFVIENEYQRQLCEKYISDSSRFQSPWCHGIFSDETNARAWCEAGNAP